MNEVEMDEAVMTMLRMQSDLGQRMSAAGNTMVYLLCPALGIDPDDCNLTIPELWELAETVLSS